MLHALCSASNLRAREKRRKTSVQADSQGHVSPVSRAYDVLFGLSTLISNRILFHNLCEIEYPASGTLEHDQRQHYADVPFPHATKEIGDVCTQASLYQVPLQVGLKKKPPRGLNRGFTVSPNLKNNNFIIFISFHSILSISFSTITEQILAR